MKKRIPRIPTKALAALLMSLTLFACGGGGGGADGSDTGSDSNGTATVSGTGQKGPFQPGGTATATRLAGDGSDTGDQVSGSIDTDGDYQLPELGWTGATAISLEGTYFDEIAGNFTSDSRRLEAVVLADGDVQTNVNLFTHIQAARVRALMAGGDNAADALSQARSEIQSLLGIAATPAELDLLDAAANADEADGASLLLFSAAVEQAGLSQAQLDDIAADFADDGQINGAGTSAYGSVQQAAAQDSTLLDTARNSLQSQYDETPPDLGSGTGTGWVLGACAAAKLEHPRVFCDGETFEGTEAEDDGEPILFYPPEDGYYVFTLDDPAGNLDSLSGWTVYAGEDFTGPEMGDSGSASSAPFEDVTTLDLDADEPYAVRVSVSGLDQSTDGFTLTAHQVSEGAGYYPVEISVGEPHDGRVSQLFVNGTTGGPATSWYRFTGSGTHTISTSGYVADSGGGGLRIEVYQGQAGQEAVNDLNALTSLGTGYADGSDSTEVQVDADAGRPVFVLVTNQFTDFRRTSFRPAAGWVEFTLQVSEP